MKNHKQLRLNKGIKFNLYIK